MGPKVLVFWERNFTLGQRSRSGVSGKINMLRLLNPLVLNIETRELPQNVCIKILCDFGSNIFELTLSLAVLQANM